MNKQTIFNMLVSGAAACFRRPEFSDDLVTYDAMPPTVARRLLDAVFPGASDCLILRKIVVMNPIRSRWQDIVTGRGLCRALVLIDVSYLIQASISRSKKLERGHVLPGISRIPSAMTKVHLGLTDFPATLSLPDAGQLPRSALTGSGSIDLGWMLCDIDRGSRRRFSRLTMTDGEIDLAEQDDSMRAS